MGVLHQGTALFQRVICEPAAFLKKGPCGFATFSKWLFTVVFASYRSRRVLDWEWKIAWSGIRNASTTCIHFSSPPFTSVGWSSTSWPHLPLRELGHLTVREAQQTPSSWLVMPQHLGITAFECLRKNYGSS